MHGKDKCTMHCAKMYPNFHDDCGYSLKLIPSDFIPCSVPAEEDGAPATGDDKLGEGGGRGEEEEDDDDEEKDHDTTPAAVLQTYW